MITDSLRAEYSDVIKHVSGLMENNIDEWAPRYKGYLGVLDPKSVECIRIKRAKNLFQIEKPLTRYLSITYAKEAKSTIVFDLRVYGHSIGNLRFKLNKKAKELLDAETLDRDKILKIRDSLSTVSFKRDNGRSLVQVRNLIEDKNDDLYIHLDRWIKNNIVKKLKDYSEEILECTDAYELLDSSISKSKSVSYSWVSPELSELRSILQAAEDKFNLESEHSCENLLLKQLAQTDGKIKYIKHIQPVTVCDTGFFQLATCLKGSEAKKSYENISYAKQNGGGIDILARISEGSKAELCVIELKDKYEYPERPIKAMKQAIAYSVFLDYLIRAEQANNADLSWYSNVFTDGRPLKDSIRINVVAAMPYKAGVSNPSEISNEDKSLVNEEIKINVCGHEDTLVLHYMFFKPEALRQYGIENGIVTSLFDK